MDDLWGLTSPLVAVLLGVFAVASLLFAAWVGAVDIALSRMSLALAEDLEEEGRKRATALASAVRSRREAALTLLVPRGAAQALGLVALTTLLLTQFARLGMPWGANLAATAGVVALAVTGSLSLLAALVSGERYIWVALRGAPFAERLIRRTTGVTARGRRGERRRAQMEVGGRLAVADELRELVDEVSEGEPADLDDDDREIIRSVFELGQTRVDELMVPRGEMVTIHGDESAEDAASLFLQSGFSRVPVIGRNTDDVLGVLYLKDVVRRLHGGGGRDDHHSVTAADMMRVPSFVPEMKLADDELRVMQETNTHMALVVDEYGGIAGLVTIEDILEELVGELTDEHDHAAPEPVELEEGCWEVPSSFSLDDLEDLVGQRFDDDDVNSVGGLLGKLLGKVPLPGATARIGRVVLKAGEDVGRRRQIRSVRVTAAPEGADEQEAELDEH